MSNLAASTIPPIVGMGASAGGLEALQQFFSCMSSNSGLAYVVIQHLSPDHKSLMAEILGKGTSMRVFQAENAMQVEPDTVYLIPPKMNMTIKDGRLILKQYPHGGINHPIDVFFTSLAEEMKERAIAVVFSGTGSDGTNGIKVVKEHGGLVIVQSPATAKFDGMPKNAINTGLADFVLSPSEIVEELLNVAQYPSMMQPHQNVQVFSDEESLVHVYSILKKASNIDFSYYKRSTVMRRIERRMVVTHCATLSDYTDILEKNLEEAQLLAKDILIGVTRFFRDKELFEKLKATAVRRIVEKSTENVPIRVWSAGCSTGEEAYSAAILFREVLDETGLERDVKIFATDIDAKAVERAGKGIYSDDILDDVSTERLSKFFVKKNDQYQISKDIRRMIIFATHNMTSDPPFGKLDLIICRNVLIYFQPVLQRSLFSIFHSALKAGGYLFLGKSETAGEYLKVFTPVGSLEKIYMHHVDSKVSDLTLPMFNIPSVQTVHYPMAEISRSEDNVHPQENVYTQFLERFLPATVILDKNNNILHFFGDYYEYLNSSIGKASLNFFNVINKDLCLAASTAINRCREEHESITYTDVCVDCFSGRKCIDLVVQSVPRTTNEEELLAVMFVEDKAVLPNGPSEKYNIDATAARRINDLERELRESREDLKKTIGELETVNEELQAANEELLTANEELQSSNEELQSVNEELYTVNSEYQQKLDELTMMTNDLSNFLSSTMIGILFVDSKLNIRKFAEYIGREFQLLSHDVGRPIQIFAHSFPKEDIIADAESVLKDLVPIDREVVAMNGRFYTLRIAPYRTTENNIRGLVITIIDSLGEAKKESLKSQ